MSDTFYSAADMYSEKYRNSRIDTQQTVDEERGISTKLLIKLALSIILFVSIYSLKDAESLAMQKVYQVIYDRVIVDHVDTTVLYNQLKDFTIKTSDQITLWLNLNDGTIDPDQGGLLKNDGIPDDDIAIGDAIRYENGEEISE